MFLFVFFSLINYLSDNIENAEYANVGKEDGYSIRRAIRPETQACNAESEQEDSNLNYAVLSAKWESDKRPNYIKNP